MLVSKILYRIYIYFVFLVYGAGGYKCDDEKKIRDRGGRGEMDDMNYKLYCLDKNGQLIDKFGKMLKEADMKVMSTRRCNQWPIHVQGRRRVEGWKMGGGILHR